MDDSFNVQFNMNEMVVTVIAVENNGSIYKMQNVTNSHYNIL